MVQPYLDYCLQACSPYLKTGIAEVEKRSEEGNQND